MANKTYLRNRKRVASPTGIAQIFGLFVLILCCTTKVNAQTPETTKACVPPEVTIAGTQVQQISSAITKKDYALYINLPGGYADTTKTFPVCYLIDAQWDFPLFQAIYGEQYYDGFIPEIIIVGITWGGENPDYDKLRAHDFTPTDVSKMGTFGNASNFLSFISTELIPYIEVKYRVKTDDRTLIGSSYGGLFSLYALFQKPAVFNRFILTSPALEWDNKYTYSLNKSFLTQNGELDAKVFAAVGEYEDVNGFKAFFDEVKASQYKNLDLQTWVVQGMGHSGAKADGYSRGLQTVFARKEIAVDPAVLATYTGKYVHPQFTLTLIQEESKLIALLPDNSKITLIATSNEDFHVPGQFLNVHFEKDTTRNVTGFTLQQYGGSLFFKRVNP
jgi:hypothetical protein